MERKQLLYVVSNSTTLSYFMKNDEIKLAFFSLFVFILSSIVSYLLLDNRREYEEQQYLEQITDRYQRAYNTIYAQYKQLAVNIHTGIIKRYDIQDIYKALLTANPEEKNRLRTELLNMITPRYEEFVEQAKVRQLHFHLNNNESFLRLHRPEKYGDNLTKIRATVRYVNEKHVPIDGFEEGRIYNGYRFVFPITATDKTHLGSMEISFDPASFTSAMMQEYFVLSNFFIRASIAEKKVFPAELERNYTRSHHKGYLYDKNVLAALKNVSNKEMQELKPQQATIDAIHTNFNAGRALSLYDSTINMVFTTIPVVNPVSNEMIAVFTVRSKSPYLLKLQHHFNQVYFLSLLVLAMAVYSFFILYSKRKMAETHSKLLEEQVRQRTEKLENEIKERKSAQTSLQESEKRYRSLFNNSSIVMLLIDPDKGTIVDANKAAADYYGWSVDILIKKSIADINTLSKDEILLEMEKAKLEKRRHFHFQHRLANGEIRNVEVYSNPIMLNGRNLLFSVIHDITDRKLLEKQLQQAQKLESIGTLAGGIAHDFNNLLGAILGYSEMALDQVGKDSAIHKHLDKVLLAGNRAKELIAQILAFSRETKSEQIPLQPEPIIKETVKLLRSSIPTTINIKQEIDAGCGLIKADPTQLHQVVMNLCTNAYQAMEEKGGTLSVGLSRTELTQSDLQDEYSLQPGKYCCLSVADDGPGIDPHLIKHIFDPFFTTKEIGKGTGMGLAVVHGIVKDHGGMIRVDSNKNAGATFSVFFPAMKGNTALQAPLDNQSIATGNERILFVDDEILLAEMGEQLLERLGYSVTAVTDSTEALSTFKANPDQFDVVITDQTMAGMTGAELSRQLLKINPELPIILCTGYSNTITEEQAKAMGIHSFVLKPMTKRDIAPLLRRIFDDEKEKLRG